MYKNPSAISESLSWSKSQFPPVLKFDMNVNWNSWPVSAWFLLRYWLIEYLLECALDVPNKGGSSCTFPLSHEWSWTSAFSKLFIQISNYMCTRVKNLGTFTSVFFFFTILKIWFSFINMTRYGRKMTYCFHFVFYTQRFCCQLSEASSFETQNLNKSTRSFDCSHTHQNASYW